MDPELARELAQELAQELARELARELTPELALVRLAAEQPHSRVQVTRSSAFKGSKLLDGCS